MVQSLTATPPRAAFPCPSACPLQLTYEKAQSATTSLKGGTALLGLEDGGGLTSNNSGNNNSGTGNSSMGLVSARAGDTGPLIINHR